MLLHGKSQVHTKATESSKGELNNGSPVNDEPHYDGLTWQRKETNSARSTGGTGTGLLDHGRLRRTVPRKRTFKQ